MPSDSRWWEEIWKERTLPQVISEAPPENVMAQDFSPTGTVYIVGFDTTRVLPNFNTRRLDEILGREQKHHQVESSPRLKQFSRSGYKIKEPLSAVLLLLCPGLDLNQQALRRYHLKVVSLPISPPGRTFVKHSLFQFRVLFLSSVVFD